MIRYGGINHLAMVTNDMEKTVRFYRDILGFRLVAATGNRPGSYPYRHYFFEIGPANSIAFFEWPGLVEEFRKPAGLPVQGQLQFDHVSFNVEDEESLLALQRRLREAEIEVTRVVDHGFIHSVYFHDPNGIALEASVWIKDPTGKAIDYEDPILFQDPDPVPALREAMEEAQKVPAP